MSTCNTATLLQLNSTISNSQEKRKIKRNSEIIDSKWLKGKSKGKDFELEITGNSK